LRVVLDTCILKLATFPGENNASALIFELARAGLIEAWVSPAIFEEYADVLGDHPGFVAEIVESCRECHPLTELNAIRHEPDNRLPERALAAIETVRAVEGVRGRVEVRVGLRLIFAGSLQFACPCQMGVHRVLFPHSVLRRTQVLNQTTQGLVQCSTPRRRDPGQHSLLNPENRCVRALDLGAAPLC
jgi:hypothetical protein